MPHHQWFTIRKIAAAAIFLQLFCWVAAAQSPTSFRIGERITYSVSFDKYPDIAYAELQTVSRGALSGRDAIELRSKIKTLNLISAAFYQVDELRTTFVSPDLGTPLYSKRTEDPDGLPREFVVDQLKNPSANLDLLTLIFKIRHAGGSGVATLQENDKTYAVTFSPAGVENLKVPAGEFETTVVTIQSEYFTERGIREVRVNLSNDDAKVPVAVRLKMARGSFRAEAASIQMILPEPAVTPSPTPSPTVVATPRPTPVRTPDPYIPNRPLSPDLSFSLGETLEFRLTAAGRPIGSFVLRVRDRTEIGGRDTLTLSATVTNAAAGNPLFALNDSMVAQADPESLVPRRFEMKFSGGLNGLSQIAVFDEATGKITFKPNEPVDAPNGTHSILTLIYAMRSFNLKPSNAPSNPVNDTRVAVFWESRPYVFTLRPSTESQLETALGKLSAQMIAVNTGNSVLDQLAIKVWLSNDDRRLPLRFSVGMYQADLVSVSNIPAN